MPSAQDPTEAYLPRLIGGDVAALLAGFSSEPNVADPLGGHVRGRAPFEQFAAERHAWLAERAARMETLRTTRGPGRTVVESLLHWDEAKQPMELPVAVVGEQAGVGRLGALRVYHSLWPLYGAHRVRAALLPLDRSLHVTDVVAEYQRALAEGDIDAIVAAFEPDGYFREPAGGPYLFRGHQQLREFMAHLLGSGGIGLEHCTVTDDGVACAIEFNAVKFGTRPLVPQAGLAVYERGPSGWLSGARIYDDVNVEALAGS